MGVALRGVMEWHRLVEHSEPALLLYLPGQGTHVQCNKKRMEQSIKRACDALSDNYKHSGITQIRKDAV